MIILNSDLPHLAPEFDAESWDFIQVNHPRYAAMLEREIVDGKKPDDIWRGCRRMLPVHRHNTICFRLFQAARHLYREAQQE